MTRPFSRCAFDVETDGFLRDATTIHSLVIKCLDTGEVMSCADGAPDPYALVWTGLDVLWDADVIVGHNIVGFDIPAIRKITRVDLSEGPSVVDTLIMSQLSQPHLKDDDLQLVRKRRLPVELAGRHKLEAWGHRLGLHKGDFKGPWTEWTEEMQRYCEQDVEVTAALFHHLSKEQYAWQAFLLEHEMARICQQIEANGAPFDEEAATALYGQLKQEATLLQDKLVSLFPPTEVQLKTKVKYIPFNPTSRPQIEKRLRDKYGWEPTEFTDGGQAKIDDEILNALPYPEARELARLFMLQKRLGSLAEGKGALLRYSRRGRIHGSVNPMGTVTGRASHSSPNMAQIPSCDAEYGKEFRRLVAEKRKGYRLVGADASGLELRCLGHFLALYDGGDFAREVIEGDVHTRNQIAAGLPTRSNAKTFIYAFLYGAGDEKIGSIIGKGAEAGKKIKSQFLKGLPALSSLVEALRNRIATESPGRNGQAYWKLKPGTTIKGLDGRRIAIRSTHAALNTLLQSAGALVCKAWLVILDRRLRERGYKHGVDADYAFIAWVHDEVQITCREEIAEEIGKLATECVAEAGRLFGFRCPLAGDYKIGGDWSETH